MPMSAIVRPKVVEPAHGRRKARIECPIEGCKTPIICTWLMCRDCWRTLPKAFRTAVNTTWRNRKAWTKGDGKEMRSYLRERHWWACENAILRLERDVLQNQTQKEKD